MCYRYTTFNLTDLLSNPQHSRYISSKLCCLNLHVFPTRAWYSLNTPQIKQSKLISSKDLDHGALDLLLSDSFNAVVKVSVPLCFINIYTFIIETYMLTVQFH